MQNALHTGELRLKRKAIADFVQRRANTIIEIISALFILLFVYTALSKLTDLERFQNVLNKSPLIGNFAFFTSLAIPTVELLISVLLFLPKTRLLGLKSSFTLMTIFTLYIGYMMAFTPDLPCSCGGVIQQMTWMQHLLFNIGFTSLAVLAIYIRKNQHQKTR